MWCLGLILLFATAALALFPGGRFLEDKPDPNLCAQSKFLVILNKIKLNCSFVNSKPRLPRILKCKVVYLAMHPVIYQFQG